MAPSTYRRRLGRAGAAAGLVGVGLVLLGATLARDAPSNRAQAQVERGRLPARPATVRTTALEPRLGRVAALLAGLGTEVWCHSPRDWSRRVAEVARRTGDRLGTWRAYTDGRPPLIHLSPQVCAQLAAGRRMVPAGADAADALAWSLATLAHEAQHVAGVADEAVAECRGLQSIARTARLLGFSAREGRLLAERYARRWYAWLPPAYRSRKCRNGGRLDLRPRSDVWP